MKWITSLCSAAAISVIAVGAQAADLPVAPEYKAPPPPAAYNWTGIYFGVNGGYGWGQQDPLNIITDRFDRFSTSLSGGVFGGTAGAQIQVAHVVLGFESDLDWANLRGSADTSPTVAVLPLGLVHASTEISYEATARARVGYAYDNFLLYSTGGLAVLGAKTTLTTVTGGTLCQTICSIARVLIANSVRHWALVSNTASLPI